VRYAAGEAFQVAAVEGGRADFRRCCH
jgi:hypothetical protein